MPYYQILKQRRLDLNLSVQDIAIQTRLKPEYVRAIEENNLDVFSDDFSYVRYFVHGYCDAIGVRWDMIRDEVDATISAYASARDQALAQAQMRMIESVKPIRADEKTARKNRRRRKSTAFKKSAGRLSRNLSWGRQNKLAKLIIVVTACAVVFLAGFSYFSRSSARKMIEAQEQERQAKLQEQEATTQRMADELKNRKESNAPAPEQPAPTWLPVTFTYNTYTGLWQIDGLDASNPVLHFEITPAYWEYVSLYFNDQPVFSDSISSLFTYDLNVAAGGTLCLGFSSLESAGTVTINGTTLDEGAIVEEEDGSAAVYFLVPAITDQPAEAQEGY